MARTVRWISMLALAAGGSLAGARGLDENATVWIENQSFGFEACAAAAGVEDATATLAALRNSAGAQVVRVAQRAGLALGDAQFMTLTPLDGHLACGAQASRVTFRVVAVDRERGTFWSTDLTVRGGNSASDATEVADLATDLGRAVRSVYTLSARR